MGEFYDEPEGTLDAVVIGPSGMYASWIAPLAWERYGIAVYPFVCNSQSLAAARFLIEEARKTQPDAVFVISLYEFDNIPQETGMHYLIDYLPASFTKFRLIQALCDLRGDDIWQRMEFFSPIIRYHSRWNELVAEDFQYVSNGYKGASYYEGFLNSVKDVSRALRTTEKEVSIGEPGMSIISELLDYLEKQQIRAVFVNTPVVMTNEYRLAQINAVADLCRARGFLVIDEMALADEIGIDRTKDYYNEGHTNIHGAIKITDYLSRYFIEQYGFMDKRGDPSYQSWDTSYVRYTEEISPYVLETEWQGEKRDETLATPGLLQVSVSGTRLTVSWGGVDHAEGYRIYRKSDAGWERIGHVENTTTRFADNTCEPGKTYTYTVIAYRRIDDTVYWSGYDFAGVEGTATLPAAKLIGLHGTLNDLTISWEPVDGADGYRIYRKLPAKSWIIIDEVQDVTSYTDTAMMDEVAYQYTVMPYYVDESGNNAYGNYDKNGLLWMPEIDIPAIDLSNEEGGISLAWSRIEGIGGYTVERKREGEEWETLLTADLSADAVGFHDVTAQAGETYAYRVTAFIRAGKETFESVMQTQPEWIEATETLKSVSAPELAFIEQFDERICLSWKPAQDASAYRIYRRQRQEDGSWSEWQVINKSSAEITYFDQPASTGEYEYAIQPLIKDEGYVFFGEFDPEAGYGIVYR